MDFRKFSVGDYRKIFENLQVKELNSVKDSDGYLIVNTNIDHKPFSQDYRDIFIVRNNSPYEHLVYVLPNDKMIEHECVSDHKKIPGHQHIRLYLYFDEGKLKTSNWPGEFLIDLRDPNHEERMKLICDKQRYHIKTPVVLNNPEKMWYIDAKTYRCLLLKWNIPFSFPPYNFFSKILVWGKKVQELSFRAGGVLYFAWGGEVKEYRPNHFDHAYARIPGTDNFYFVPMTAFVENDKIGYNKSSKEMKVSLDMNKPTKGKNKWIDQYRFNFNDTDIYERFNFLINGIIPKGKEELESSEGEKKSEGENSSEGEEGMVEVETNQREYSHIIGESPIEEIFDAVALEYETGLRPKVIQEKIRGNESHIERYAIYLAIYAINQSQEGKAGLSHDGGNADFFYHQANLNKCLGIQVKSTARGRTKTRWSFLVDKKYDNLLMYFRSLEDGMAWLIPYKTLKSICPADMVSISVGPGAKRDWSKYRVWDNQLADAIAKYYSRVGKDKCLGYKKLKDVISPTSDTMKLEQKIRAILVSYLRKMGFKVETPILENMVYDIIVNGLKVQEKLARISKGSYLDVDITKRYKGKNVPYHERDFHSLFIHCPAPYENILFVLPTFKLKDNGLVSTDETTGRQSLTINANPNPDKSNWTREFMLQKDDPNIKEKILNIFHMQRSGEHTPLALKNYQFRDIEARNFQQMLEKWNFPFTSAKPTDTFKRLIKGERCHELQFVVSKSGYCLCLSYLKQNVKHTYKPDDFDFAYCKLKDKYSDFFLLIPMREFINSNLINFTKSAAQVTINYNMEKRTSNFDWFFKYLYGFKDTNFYERFDNFLAEL